MAKDDLFSRISQAAKNRVKKVLDSTTLDDKLIQGVNRVKTSFREDPGQYLPTRAFQNLKANPITAPKTGAIARGGYNTINALGNTQPVQFAVKNFAQPYLTTQNKPLRYAQQFAKGVAEGSNLGLVHGPGVPARGGGEQVANIAGNFAGALNPKTAAGRFYTGVNAATNPLLGKVVGRFAPGASQRVAAAAANIGQGIGIDKTLGQQTTPLSIGMDAVSGLVAGRSGFDVPNAKGFGSGRNSSIQWRPEDADLLDQSMEYLQNNRKIANEALSGIDDTLTKLADGYLYKDQIEKVANKSGGNQRKFLIDLGKELQKSFRRVGEEDTFNIPKLGIVGGKSATGYKNATKFSSLLDQKPRFEIDDSGAKLDVDSVLEMQEGKRLFKLDKLLNHDELFKNYPQLRNTGVVLTDDISIRGNYDPANNIINLSPNARSDKYTLLHEIQHAIQEIEGFARGGSPEQVIKSAEDSQTLINFMRDPSPTNKQALENTRSYRDLLQKYSPTEVYARLSGELESRAVQRRMDMSADQRGRIDPYADEAIATTGTTNPNDFITRFDSGNQALRIKPQDQPKLKLKSDKVPGQIDRTKLVGSNLGKSNASLERIFGDNAAPIVKAVDPKNKVNLLDYIRTPEKVLKKLGLEKNAKLIQKKYGDYLEDLPKEINKVTEWYQRVGKSQDSSQRIFQWLDGKKDTPLDPVELEVAKEMQGYLEQWADKLQLPKDKRIASYITHIFDDDFIQKDFDPELAKIISDKIPGEVYDPFLQERLGKLGYVEDAFRALDAYVKRATRKYHMDQALNPLRRAVGKTAEESHLDLDSWQYVKSYVDNVNMRPQKVDRLLDDMIKALPGGQTFGSRPTSRITKKLRTMVYRGTLGLNMGSALKNLTQGVNTYAELGEKYTTIGYTKAMFNLARKDPELNRVLSDSFIQDRNLSAKKQLFQKMDKGLFVFFDLAEKINRSSAYYGAKSKALAQGMNEQAAKQYAEDIVRKTQFTFGSVDTPVVMQGDIAKTLLQFQSFNIKQAEFLGEMIKNKEFGKMMRWLGANLLVITAFGDLLGMDIKDLIPTVKVGGSPIFQLGGDLFKAAVDAPDRYGNDQDAEDKIRTIGKDTVPFIPAGVQIKKTIEGQRAVEQGKATDRSGRTKFEVPNTAYNRIVAPTLGVYRTSEAQDYFDKKSGKSESTLLGRLLKPGSQVSASDGVMLPQTREGMARVYEMDKKIVDSYEQKRFDTEYKQYKDEETRQKRLEELDAEYQAAQSRLERISKQDPKIVSDADYYEKATAGNADERYQVILDDLRQVYDGTSRKPIFDYLVQNQRKVNGKNLITSSVIDQLYKQGVLNKYERDLLKGVSFTSDGQVKFKLPTTATGSSRKRKVFTFKPSSINYSKLRVKAPSLPNINTRVDLTRLNTPVLPRVKLASIS